MTAIITIRVYTYTLLRFDEYTGTSFHRNGFSYGRIVPDTSTFREPKKGAALAHDPDL
jgi:hypothetical protein